MNLFVNLTKTSESCPEGQPITVNASCVREFGRWDNQSNSPFKSYLVYTNGEIITVKETPEEIEWAIEVVTDKVFQSFAYKMKSFR